MSRTFIWTVPPVPGQEQGGAALSGLLGWLAVASLAAGVAATALVVRGRRPATKQPTLPDQQDELAPF